MEKIKPKLNLKTLLFAIYRIYQQKTCPACRSIEPYYRDCEICEGYVIGCDVAKFEDILIKYITWLK